MTKKIGLVTAILINVNIIIGAGVFLNVKPLTQIAGSLGFCGYLLGATILLPFVYVLTKLAQANPVSGGLYAYSKKYISPFIGFISGWSYFVGKTVSAAFLSLAFTNFFQNNIPFLHQYPTLLLACIVIFSLIFINILGAQIGGSIQYAFIATKVIPILFVFIAGISILQIDNFTMAIQPLTSIVSTVPIALYALMGFEITCSIGHMLKNPTINIPRAILGSFIGVAIVYILFQGIIFGALGVSMITTTQPFIILANKIFTSYPLIGQLITTLIFTSVIAGSFGILTSNCWNLHALAKGNHLPGEKFLTKTSCSNIPWVSLLFEGIIACFMLVISKNQIALQSMSVFAVVIAFTFSTIAAFYATHKRKQLTVNSWILLLAIASCCYILFLCLQKIQAAGVSLPFLALLLGGIAVSLSRHKKIIS